MDHFVLFTIMYFSFFQKKETVESHIGCEEERLDSLCGLGQSPTLELTFAVELGPKSISLSWYERHVSPIHCLPHVEPPSYIVHALDVQSWAWGGEGEAVEDGRLDS